MPDSSEAHIATADALTLLLLNQHALGAAIEEVDEPGDSLNLVELNGNPFNYYSA